MESLARRRCFNHPEREAAARCPECGRFFCRECVTEHEDRVLCAQCLAARLSASTGRRSRFGGVIGGLQFMIGTWILWLFFYYLGRILVAVPASFHEGTLWREGLW